MISGQRHDRGRVGEGDGDTQFYTNTWCRDGRQKNLLSKYMQIPKYLHIAFTVKSLLTKMLAQLQNIKKFRMIFSEHTVAQTFI